MLGILLPWLQGTKGKEEALNFLASGGFSFKLLGMPKNTIKLKFYLQSINKTYLKK